MSMNLDNILALTDQYVGELPVLLPVAQAPVGAELAGWIDHTILKADATGPQITRLCEEARQYHFATVCVNPVYVALAAKSLTDSGVGVCSVVGFPLGATFPEIKAAETSAAIEAGASEIDMVINIGALKTGSYDLVFRDIRAVVEAAAGLAHVKVILEMCYLENREKIIACLLCKEAGADFVKTSTGFGAGGATVADVELMRRLVGSGMGVKAAGGIRTWADAQRMISAGANRLGASAGISILREAGVV